MTIYNIIKLQHFFYGAASFLVVGNKASYSVKARLYSCQHHKKTLYLFPSRDEKLQEFKTE